MEKLNKIKILLSLREVKTASLPIWPPDRPVRSQPMDYRTEAPEMIRAFLTYHRTIQGHSIKTVDEYYLDLRTFFRFIKQLKGRAPTGPDVDFESIPIDDVDLDLAGSVTLSDVYAFMDYLDRDRSLNAASRARKVATIRSFYKYLTSKAKLLRDNPMQDLDAPRLKKTLPRYLQLDQCIQLLESVDEPNRARDYCILTLFLNCGLRISELVALNVTDVRENQIRILGKGNKERILFLNDACRAALDDWLEERSHQAAADPNALFLTRSHTRMTRDAVHYMVKQRLKKAGLDSTLYSSHKLRHTAATLMLQNGVDVRTLQEVLGHENLNTTQIYTHVDSENLRTAAKANPLAKVRPRKKQPEHASSAEESGQTSPEK